MTSSTVDDGPRRPRLTLGRLDRVRVQVGYRASPEDPAHEQFLLDLGLPDPDGVAGSGVPEALGERRILAALEPVLYAGGEAPRHYSLHQHRWHTTWGLSPAAMELGLLVTTGSRDAAVSEAVERGVTAAFRELLSLADPTEPAPTAREAAIAQARRSTATAFAVAMEALTVSTEMHHPEANSWTVGLRTTAGENYDVVVGLVDGYAGSVRVRHQARVEAFDSVGAT